MDEDQEIEATAEMIEAGATILAGWHPDFESYEDAVGRIYRAMERVRKPPPEGNA